MLVTLKNCLLWSIFLVILSSTNLSLAGDPRLTLGGGTHKNAPKIGDTKYYQSLEFNLSSIVESYEEQLYDDIDLQRLIDTYVGTRENAEVFIGAGMNVDAYQGQTFLDTIQANETALRRRAQLGAPEIQDLLYIVNLGQKVESNFLGAHWAVVWIQRHNNVITYIDPFGTDIPEKLKVLLSQVYPEATTESVLTAYQNINDQVNCGPYAIEIVRSIIRSNTLPQPGLVNIGRARNEHQACLARYPRAYLKETDLQTTSSANKEQSCNQTYMSRLVMGEHKVFVKRYKGSEEVVTAKAQREIIVAEFVRQLVGKAQTSWGRVLLGKNSKILGISVFAIPGFVSLRALEAILDRGPAIIELRSKLAELRAQSTSAPISSTEQKEQEELTALINTYNAFLQVASENGTGNLLDTEIFAEFFATILCPAFFFEDWDRHKDNIGFSFSAGKLASASIDWDKAMSTQFLNETGQKAYSCWNFTAQRLMQFPVLEGDCWYWPTCFRKIEPVATGLRLNKAKKMYQIADTRRYSALKDSPKFRQRALREWLKLIFIPLELRELSVQELISVGLYMGKFQYLIHYLEAKRVSLMDALVQLNEFRDSYNSEMLKSISNELALTLTPAEQKIYLANRPLIEDELINKIKHVRTLEKTALNLGYPTLVAATQQSGISFLPILEQSKFIQILETLRTSIVDGDSKSMYHCYQDLGVVIPEDLVRPIQNEFIFSWLSLKAKNLTVLLQQNDVDGLTHRKQLKAIIESITHYKLRSANNDPSKPAASHSDREKIIEELHGKLIKLSHGNIQAMDSKAIKFALELDLKAKSRGCCPCCSIL